MRCRDVPVRERYSTTFLFIWRPTVFDPKGHESVQKGIKKGGRWWTDIIFRNFLRRQLLPSHLRLAMRFALIFVLFAMVALAVAGGPQAGQGGSKSGSAGSKGGQGGAQGSQAGSQGGGRGAAGGAQGAQQG